jgi:ATP-dependent exoDNAse (exonuclease V) beta subunit
VLARNTLRDPLHGANVRSVLHSKYQRLLLDEFQDTDPIQIELAVLIASSPTSDSSRSWQSLSVEPGRLFFVGDPKQSIYRFRRADISLFLEARNKFTTEATELSTNFRSVTPIIEWVNSVFNNLIQYEAGSQPEYKGLVPFRDPAPSGPGVGLIGQSAHHKKSIPFEPQRLRILAPPFLLQSKRAGQFNEIMNGLQRSSMTWQYLFQVKVLYLR